MGLTRREALRILGLEEGATQRDTRERFKKLALKWHPDKNFDNPEEAQKKFQLISSAYTSLLENQEEEEEDMSAAEFTEFFADFLYRGATYYPDVSDDEDVLDDYMDYAEEAYKSWLLKQFLLMNMAHQQGHTRSRHTAGASNSYYQRYSGSSSNSYQQRSSDVYSHSSRDASWQRSGGSYWSGTNTAEATPSEPGEKKKSKNRRKRDAKRERKAAEKEIQKEQETKGKKAKEGEGEDGIADEEPGINEPLSDGSDHEQKKEKEGKDSKKKDEKTEKGSKDKKDQVVDEVPEDSGESSSDSEIDLSSAFVARATKKHNLKAKPPAGRVSELDKNPQTCNEAQSSTQEKGTQEVQTQTQKLQNQQNPPKESDPKKLSQAQMGIKEHGSKKQGAPKQNAESRNSTNDLYSSSDVKELKNPTFVASSGPIENGTAARNKPQNKPGVNSEPENDGPKLGVQPSAKEPKPDVTQPGILPPELAEASLLKSRQLAALGNKAAKESRYEEAIQKFSQAISHYSSDHRYFGNRSYCYDYLQKYTSALEDANEALRLCPNWAKGYFRKGRALCGLKRYKEAEKAFMKAVEINPDYKDASEELKKLKGFDKGGSEKAPKEHRKVQEPTEPAPKAKKATFSSPSSGLLKPHLENLPPRLLAQQEREIQPKSCTVWIGNLNNPDITESKLFKLFSTHGDIASIRLLPARRCAFINYSNARGAAKAMKNLQGHLLLGCNLLLKYPENPPPTFLESNKVQKKSGPVNGNECYFWRTTGCSYGPRCRYQHIKENKGADLNKTSRKVVEG